MRVLTGGAIAISAALILQVPVTAQRGARPPMFPTKDQFAASVEAGKHVAAARTIAGTDLLKELENTCSSTATARVIALEQASGRTH